LRSNVQSERKGQVIFSHKKEEKEAQKEWDSKVEESKAKQSKAKQSKAKQSKAKQDEYDRAINP
jgi:hypothetical protein